MAIYTPRTQRRTKGGAQSARYIIASKDGSKKRSPGLSSALLILIFKRAYRESVSTSWNLYAYIQFGPRMSDHWHLITPLQQYIPPA
jgi:hypothetical protein